MYSKDTEKNMLRPIFTWNVVAKKVEFIENGKSK